MRRRLGISLAMLVAGAALSRGRLRWSEAGATGGHAARRREGGTLRVGVRTSTSTPSTRRSASHQRRLADPGRDVREALQLPGRRGGAPGRASCREVVDGFTVSRDRRTYTFDAEEDVPLPHRRAGDRAELRRRVRPRRPTEARVAGRRAYMREIVGAASGDRRQGAIDLRRPRARPLPAADPADQAVGDFTARLTMPFFCPILPTRRSIRRDRRPGRLGPLLRRRAVVNQRIVLEAQPVLSRRPPGQRRPGRLDDRREPGGLPARRRAGPDRLLRVRRSPASVRALAEKYGINRPGGQFFVGPIARDLVRRLQPQPAGVQGARPDPARRRRSTTRSTGPRWPAPSATSQASAPTDAATRARPPCEHLPARGRRTRATARQLVRAGAAQAERARPLRVQQPIAVAQAQMLAFNLKQLGIDLEVKYFDTECLAREDRRPAASRSTSPCTAGRPTTPTPAGVLRAAARPRGAPSGVNLDDPRVNRANRGGEPPDRRGATQGVGRPRRRPDARQPTLGAVRAHSEPHARLAEPRLLLAHPILRLRHRGAVQEAMTRRLSLPLAMLAVGTALLVAASRRRRRRTRRRGARRAERCG